MPGFLRSGHIWTVVDTELQLIMKQKWTTQITAYIKLYRSLGSKHLHGKGIMDITGYSDLDQLVLVKMWGIVARRMQPKII